MGTAARRSRAASAWKQPAEESKSRPAKGVAYKKEGFSEHEIELIIRGFLGDRVVEAEEKGYEKKPSEKVKTADDKKKDVDLEGLVGALGAPSINGQFDRNIGFFTCKHAGLFSDKDLELAPGVRFTKVVDLEGLVGALGAPSIKGQFDRNIGIFTCERTGLFSHKDLELAPGVRFTKFVDVEGLVAA